MACKASWLPGIARSCSVGIFWLAMAAAPVSAQYDGNSGAVDAAVMGMYGAANRDQTALRNRQDAETRDADNRAFWGSWDSFNQRAMQRAIINANQKKAALAACRRTAQGCTGRFTPGAGNPGAAMIARELGKSPQEQARINALAVRHLATYRQVATHLGLPTNDIAGPMAYAFLTAMQVNTGQSPGITRPLTQIVVGQARQMIANNGGIALLDNAKRQEHAEALAINGAYLATEFTEAQRTNDAPRMARTKQLAAQVVRAITGVEPAALAVTSKGVVETGVKSAAGSGGTVAPVLNAASSTRFAPNGGAPLDRQNAGLINQFNQLLRQRGGDPNDLGWGMAGSFAILYFIAQGVEVNNRQLAGTARFASQLFLSSNDGARSTDSDRQQIYERMAVDAMGAYEEFQRAQSSGDTYIRNIHTNGARERARNSLRVALLPYSLSDFDLMPDGLVLRRK
jgi:hypothetical protein